MSEVVEEIKKIINDFLSIGGFSNFDLGVRESRADDLIFFNIQMQDAKFLIGEKGRNLDALNFVIKTVVLRKLKDIPRFIIDINNYKKDRINDLKEVAKTAAQRVILTKSPFELPPMSAFERRVIHLELTANPNVKTESSGDGELRHIILKPND